MVFRKLRFRKFFFQISVVFSAWCDKKNPMYKNNLGILDSQSSRVRLDKNFCKKDKKTFEKIAFFGANSPSKLVYIGGRPKKGGIK